MALVRGRDTAPELTVRKCLRSLRVRYSARSLGLPGRPDIVLTSRQVVVFVHGCFWHRHRGCARTRTPKTHKAFWNQKFKENVARDRRVQRALARLGWRVIVVWECQTKNADALRALLETKAGARK